MTPRLPSCAACPTADPNACPTVCPCTVTAGVTTALAAYKQFYGALKQHRLEHRGLSDANGLAHFLGVTVVLVLMDLQAAFTYGNELLIVQELDRIGSTDVPSTSHFPSLSLSLPPPHLVHHTTGFV